MKTIYYNKNDPKIFVYNHPKHKWLGVTLNLAHAKARKFLLLGVFLPLLLVSVLGAVLFATAIFLTQQKGVDSMEKVVLAIAILVNLLCASWWIPLILYSFRMAARDAKNNP